MHFGTPGVSKRITELPLNCVSTVYDALRNARRFKEKGFCVLIVPTSAPTAAKPWAGEALSRIANEISFLHGALEPAETRVRMTSAEIEFAVNMTCRECVKSVRDSLSGVNGIESIDVSLERGTVLIKTGLPYSVVQEKIERTGKKAVLKGYGDSSSAVSMLGGNSGYSASDYIKGVIRFVQTPAGCVIDGTVDGLTPGPHGMHVHECGDISRGCDSVGEHFNPNNTVHGGPDDDPLKRHVGDLGNITANNSGRATFRIVDKLLNIPDIIGRSLVITEKADDLGRGDNEESKINGNSGNRLACGIIARSPALFQNTKKICACDGLTLWDERDKALSSSQGIDSTFGISNAICIVL